VAEGIHLALGSYRASLRDDLRDLVEQYEVVDMARKVVGVGSVGTRCYVALLQGKDHDDVLFLQIKQAEASVLEPHLQPSGYDNHGERVVTGQRLLQTVPDIFLGWSRGPDGDDYYVRQLWDMKGGIDPAKLTPGGVGVYGGLCGWTLARAHCRGGDEAPSPPTWGPPRPSTTPSPPSPSPTPTSTTTTTTTTKDAGGGGGSRQAQGGQRPLRPTAGVASPPDGHSSAVMMSPSRSALVVVQPAGCRTAAQPSTNSRW